MAVASKLEMLWQPFTAETRKKLVGASPAKMTTYRKGTKWLNPELIGTAVDLVDQKDNSTFGTAEICAVKACRFKDIDDIDQARQSSEMTLEGRLAVMQKVYGEYTNDTITTIVTLNNIKTL